MMEVILVGINSKYIHTNLSIRYLKANCDYPIALKEYTIKDKPEIIAKDLIELNPDVIGFSVYIWNIEITCKVLEILKAKKIKANIILGGPEVSYEYDEYLTSYLADYIIFNEGEIAFNLLINALANHKSLKNIPNLSYYEDGEIIKNKAKEIMDLNKLKNPYHLEHEDIKNKIQYIELSRGCPYKCSYCMASLEKKVRFFDIDRVKNDIKYLYSKGAKTFKFLDRTFNLKADVALDIYRFILDNDFEDAIFQFEINGDILSDSVIEYLQKNCPPNKIRFEIGIQSTNDLVNHSVDRNQDLGKLFENIHKLSNSNIAMHIDLIAGLPFEDYSSFKNTFNKAFKLYAKELQLGFLKLLKGTKLFYQKEEFGYIIQEKAPYELIENKYITKEELYKIHIVEETLEIYWNKGFMNQSILQLTKNIESPFEFFLRLGTLFLKQNQSFHRYQLSDVFETLETFVESSDAIYDIRVDYLSYSKIKPKIYWDNQVNKNEVIRSFHKKNPSYNIDSLYKYTVVTKYKNKHLIVIYFEDNKEVHIF